MARLSHPGPEAREATAMKRTVAIRTIVLLASGIAGLLAATRAEAERLVSRAINVLR